MASASLLALLDDIASLLDDVAAMTKVATKKTVGVLSDDLALNAQQVSGVNANREIPVVWAVAKGSILNKLIIIPFVLIVSLFIPWLIKFLLIAGGIYLCFEGAEKIIHSLQKIKNRSNPNLSMHVDAASVISPDLDSEQITNIEKQKIKGAIRTDFILSAEIIVIALNVVLEQSILTKISVLLFVALLITIGVYGIVILIIKLDDFGYWLIKKSKNKKLLFRLGQLLVNCAPYLMRFLSVIGTIAMFLVGGGIILHNIQQFSDIEHNIVAWVAVTPDVGGLLSAVSPTLISLVTGLLIGIISVIILHILKRIGQKS